MAEGWLRFLGGENYDVTSAGTNPTRVNPLAIEAMREAGVDIRTQASDRADGYTDERFDLVVTVCDRAKENCPVFSNAAEILHWGFDDPADAEGTDVERAIVFRRVRDEIRERIALYLSEEA